METKITKPLEISIIINKFQSRVGRDGGQLTPFHSLGTSFAQHDLWNTTFSHFDHHEAGLSGSWYGELSVYDKQKYEKEKVSK